MTELKLAKLPDRVPVKITFSAMPDLNQALHDYAAVYHATYGQVESVPELIPFMLASFLEGDRAFAKARKDAPSIEPERLSGRGRRRGNSSVSQPSKIEGS
jgi:hypothetical protein